MAALLLSGLRTRCATSPSVLTCAIKRIAAGSSQGSRQMATGSGGDLKWTPPADTGRAGTADLCDIYLPDPVDITTQRKVHILDPAAGFRDYGGKARFSGPISTIRCFENNPLVRQALESPGEGRVLVVDGGASMRCALLGDNLAAAAHKNGWSGIIINGCIRDSEDISHMPLGVKALATCPLKSSKRDPGLRDVPVAFGGVTFTPGDMVYADRDGVLVSAEKLVVK